MAGVAVALVHLRGVLRDVGSGPGWILLGGALAWLALTAAGPFVYLMRRYARNLPGYPQTGDRLWGMLGLPWVFTAPAQAWLSTALIPGLGVVSLISIAVLWKTWVMVTPEQAARTFSSSWTNRVGLWLSVAWPVQCGLGLVVIG
ncbi:MAG: hypothetical protein NVSMB9_26600 [Isosphaeraceae bacterium]